MFEKKNKDNIVSMNAKRKKKKKKPVTKAEIGILTAAVLLLIGLCVYIAMEFKVEMVLVVGNTTYTREEVEEAFRKQSSGNTVIDTVKAAFTKNDYLPFINRTEVTCLGKNILKLDVEEKLRAGAVAEMHTYFYFDKNGTILESSPKRLPNVPMITGLKMNKCILGEKIRPVGGKDKDIFSVILKITQLIVKYNLPVQEIQFNTLNDITLQTASLEVRLGGREEIDAKLGELPSIFRELSGVSGTINMENYSENRKIITFKEK